jgi:RNA polymerase sigma-70 factor, ECF subfamily
LEHDQILRELTQQRRMLYAFIRALVSDPHLCEDILQEVFVVAVSKCDEFTAGTNFPAWTREIARRVALAQLRKSGRAPVSLDPETIDRMEGAIEVSSQVWDEERQALKECLKQLPAESRRVIEMRYVSEISLAQIGETAGRSPDGIKALLKRLRQTLAECVSARLHRSPASEGRV